MLSDAHLEGLKEALRHGGGTHDIEHVADALEAGDAQLWVGESACIVTEVNDTPNARELHFWLATGTLEDVIALSNKVMDWGREQGCTVATLSGRLGWQKVLKAEGWEPHTVEMARRL